MEARLGLFMGVYLSNVREAIPSSPVIFPSQAGWFSLQTHLPGLGLPESKFLDAVHVGFFWDVLLQGHRQQSNKECG